MSLLGLVAAIVGFVMVLHPNTSGDVVAGAILITVGFGVTLLPSPGKP